MTSSSSPLAAARLGPDPVPATTGVDGSATAMTGEAGSATTMMGEAGGEGNNGGERVDLDPAAAAVLRRSSTMVKVVPGGGCHDDDDGYATPTPSHLLPGDHGVGFGRRRPR